MSSLEDNLSRREMEVAGRIIGKMIRKGKKREVVLVLKRNKGRTRNILLISLIRHFIKQGDMILVASLLRELKPRERRKIIKYFHKTKEVEDEIALSTLMPLINPAVCKEKRFLLSRSLGVAL